MKVGRGYQNESRGAAIKRSRGAAIKRSRGGDGQNRRAAMSSVKEPRDK
jgi:hypothetical protein